MKIGLITIYHVPNYGSVLQTYATQELLTKLGHEVSVIRYNYFNKRYYDEIGHGPSLRERFYPLKSLLMPCSKAAVLKRFRNKYLHFTIPFENRESLLEYDWSSYDAFVVGSDQVWNTRFLYGDPSFLLDFAPAGKHRYSISSSFATTSVEKKYESSFRDELLKFDAISVREQNGVNIIQKQLGIEKPVEVTLDPTLLLSKEEWLSLFPRKTLHQRKPYILYYMWAYAFEPRPYIYEVVRHFKAKMNCDVIALEGIRDSKDCQGITFINADNSTISEFIDLFSNASLVITSSFHGTAFALNFGVPVISIVPDNDGDDRQSTLLKKCGAENSIVHIGTEITTIQPEYDMQRVVSILDGIRRENINWIKAELR